MATTIPYSSREFQGINADIRANLRDALPGVNDFLESNEGRFLIDQWTAVAEMLGFTVDRQGAESYVDTVETREGLISLLRLIGYQPANPNPEQVNVNLSRAGQSNVSDFVVPKYTKLTASTATGTIPFATNNAITIPAGADTATVTCVQGEWKNTTFNSNGAPFQAFVLHSKRIAQQMIRVLVNNVEWYYADQNTLVGHKSTDRVFMTRNLPDKRMLVEFGNGGEGLVPPIGNSVQIRFFDTLGPAGHVSANEITSVDSSTLIPNNPEPSTGGRDFEPIEVARFRYPSVFKTLRRAVTLSDWEALAAQVPGVMQANAVDRNIDPQMPFFKVRVYVIGEGGITSDSLNDSVREDLRNRRVNATVFDVLSPTRINVDVQGTLNIYRQYNKDEVIADASQAVSNFFEMTPGANSEVQVGKDVSFSRLVSAIQELAGVESVLLTSPNADVKINAHEFAWLNTLDLTVGEVV